MERCDNCPLKKFSELDSIDCYSKRHARFCEHAASGESHNDLIVTKSVDLHNRENSAALEAPSMVVRSLNAAKALWKASVNAARGNVTLVPDDVKLARQSICLNCPSKMYDAEKDICTHPKCGCRIMEGIGPIPPKTAVASAKCDEGHWDEHIVARSESPPKSTGGCGCSGKK